jgi:hypothetical protein
MSELDFLVGSNISAVALSVNREYLRLDTDSGFKYFHAEGDCCSNSWFENVEILGTFGKVLSVEDLPMPPEEWKEGECINFYGISIKMVSGRVDIDYRNSSNGYYGGWLATISPDRFKGDNDGWKVVE